MSNTLYSPSKKLLIATNDKLRIHLQHVEPVIEAAKAVRRNAMGANLDTIWDALDELAKWEKTLIKAKSSKK